MVFRQTCTGAFTAACFQLCGQGLAGDGYLIIAAASVDLGMGELGSRLMNAAQGTADSVVAKVRALALASSCCSSWTAAVRHCRVQLAYAHCVSVLQGVLLLVQQFVLAEMHSCGHLEAHWWASHRQCDIATALHRVAADKTVCCCCMLFFADAFMHVHLLRHKGEQVASRVAHVL